ncbi:nuclear transport factor 2 family protein [Silvibacterium acidisoli]|uniref:nuclear transport factor 2 family protein n=1 Tax=Acidobacteriaceae bacterium ZG23-2 TaxID=2883246 RepID=UPI00406D261A
MTKDAVEKVWNSYLEAYGSVSGEDRKRLLKESVSDDVLSINPGDDTHGLENLVTHVEKFQQRLPGSYFKINSLKFHHEQVLTEWTLYKADGTAVTTAHTYGIFNDQGRLKKLIGFF